jgi:PadR family transcriptional regulator, regulatory protein PadR
MSAGALELAVLLAVARLDADAYGLAIRRDLIERLGRDYAPGAIYTTLQRLEEKGLLRSRASEPLPVRGGRTRRCYAVTGAGSRAINEARRLTGSMWSGVTPQSTPPRRRPRRSSASEP